METAVKIARVAGSLCGLVLRYALFSVIFCIAFKAICL